MEYATRPPLKEGHIIIVLKDLEARPCIGPEFFVTGIVDNTPMVHYIESDVKPDDIYASGKVLPLDPTYKYLIVGTTHK